MPKKLILAVIDGLGPAVLDRAIAEGRAPALARLQELGSRTDACVSTFPSLTPVCLSALITGEHPVGTRIPSMTWYHRDEGRFVEYGSSFLATLAEGTKQMVDDVMVNLNLLHMSPRVTTVFEALEDRGLVTAAVNTYICRGRVRHPIARHAARRIARRVGIVDAVYGPRRYFFGELFWSDETGAPRNFGGSVDRHGRRLERVPRALRDCRRGRPRPEPGGAGRGRRRAVRRPAPVPLQPPFRPGAVRPGARGQQPPGDGLPAAGRHAHGERGGAPVRPPSRVRRGHLA
jgi:hypothetical protein